MTHEHNQPTDAPDGPLRGFRRLLAIGLVRPDRAQLVFDRQHEIDARGDRWHVWIAGLALVFISGPTSLAEIAMVPLYVFSVLRLWATWRTLGWSLRQPATIACVAFGLWLSVSVLWSPDRAQGMREIERLRWLVWIPLLFPAINRRGALIGALAVGFLLVNGAQVAHAIGRAGGLEWLTFDRLPNRNAAWFDPAVGGSVMMVPLGLHLGALTMGTARWRLVGAAGVALTGLGILATGTRGAWIAGAALVGVGCVVLLIRMPTGRARLSWIAGAAGAAVVVGVLAWAVVGRTVASRFEAGVSEVRRALDEHDYASDTGSRIAMALWAGDTFVQHPFAGRGAGSFRIVMVEHVEAEQLEHIVIATHAHNMYMQVGATGGAVGLALLGLVIVTGAVNSLRPRFGAGLSGPPADPTGYHAGPAFALLGMLFVGAFDSLHVNTPTCAMLGALLALCPGWRPMVRS